MSDGEPGPDAVLFDYVVWISAKDRPEQRRWLDDVLNTVATTTNSSAITKFAAPEARQKQLEIDRILRSFKTLVIVDNFETIDDPDLVTWLEKIPEPSKALVTTQDRQLQQGLDGSPSRPGAR